MNKVLFVSVSQKHWEKRLGKNSFLTINSEDPKIETVRVTNTDTIVKWILAAIFVLGFLF